MSDIFIFSFEHNTHIVAHMQYMLKWTHTHIHTMHTQENTHVYNTHSSEYTHTHTAHSIEHTHTCINTWPDNEKIFGDH